VDPAIYEAWYHTPRGAWIARREFALIRRLLPLEPGASLLEVGCGSGHFARRFAAAGLAVTGLDPDRAALDYARTLESGIAWVEGDARTLPFADGAFDYCAAITALCFVPDPARALQEMWRVARRGVVLGLLNRHSLLHWRKAGTGGYAGARWDSAAAVRAWAATLRPPPRLALGSALLLPGGGPPARLLDPLAPPRPLWGGFLAAGLVKPW
jgi:SAM-dependent methyltransferase